jgi:hypothetical protein
MVEGVKMVFKKDLMIKRLAKEGKIGLITEGILNIMDNLDGQEVSTASWNRQVYGDPVFSCYGKDGQYYEVNQADCE